MQEDVDHVETHGVEASRQIVVDPATERMRETHTTERGLVKALGASFMKRASRL